LKQVSWLGHGPFSEPSAVSGASSQHLCKQGLNLRLPLKANKGYLPINTETNMLQFKGQQVSYNDGYDDLDIRHIEEIDRNLSHKRHSEMA